MLNLNLIPAHVISDIRDSFGLQYRGEDDIKNLSPRSAFDVYLKYQGIINYTEQIIEVWENLKKAEQVTPISADIATALEIVIQLATENIIDPRTCNEDTVEEEAETQRNAIDAIESFVKETLRKDGRL